MSKDDIKWEFIVLGFIIGFYWIDGSVVSTFITFATTVFLLGICLFSILETTRERRAGRKEGGA